MSVFLVISSIHMIPNDIHKTEITEQPKYGCIVCACFVDCEFFEPWLSTRVVASLARVMQSRQCGTILDIKQEKMERLWRTGKSCAFIVSEVLQLGGVTPRIFLLTCDRTTPRSMN